MEEMNNVVEEVIEKKNLITKDHVIGAAVVVAAEAAAYGVKKLIPIIGAKLKKTEVTEEVTEEESFEEINIDPKDVK